MYKLYKLAILMVFATASLAGRVHEHKVGGPVMLRVNKDHTVTPMLPVTLVVEQEEGQIADGVLTCDVIARDNEIVKNGEPGIGTEPVFKCGGNVFVVKKILFSASGQ